MNHLFLSEHSKSGINLNPELDNGSRADGSNGGLPVLVMKVNHMGPSKVTTMTPQTSTLLGKVNGYKVGNLKNKSLCWTYLYCCLLKYLKLI